MPVASFILILLPFKQTNKLLNINYVAWYAGVHKMWLASEIEWQLIVEYLTKQKTDHFNPFLAKPKFVVLFNLPTG